MKRERVLLILITILVLLNAATLFFVARSARPQHGQGSDPHGRDLPRGPGGPARAISEGLGLSDSQEVAYKRLREEHQAAMRLLSARYDSLLRPYFALLDAPHAPATRDTLEAALAGIQRRKAAVTFDHFVALKALCSPAQQARFRDLLPEIMEVVAGGRGPREGGPRPMR